MRLQEWVVCLACRPRAGIQRVLRQSRNMLVGFVYQVLGSGWRAISLLDAYANGLNRAVAKTVSRAEVGKTLAAAFKVLGRFAGRAVVGIIRASQRVLLRPSQYWEAAKTVRRGGSGFCAPTLQRGLRCDSGSWRVC